MHSTNYLLWLLPALVLVAQSYLTLCDPMDCSPPGSSVHGILQARILEWGAIPFPRGSSQPRAPLQNKPLTLQMFLFWISPCYSESSHQVLGVWKLISPLSSWFEKSSARILLGTNSFTSPLNLQIWLLINCYFEWFIVIQCTTFLWVLDSFIVKQYTWQKISILILLFIYFNVDHS